MNIIIKDTTFLSFNYYRVYVNGYERCRLRGFTKSMTIDDVKSGDKVFIGSMNNANITDFELDNPDGTILISRKKYSYFLEYFVISAFALYAALGNHSNDWVTGFFSGLFLVALFAWLIFMIRCSFAANKTLDITQFDNLVI